MLSYFERKYNIFNKIVSFSNNEYSDGGLYLNNGFVVDKIIKPDYMYVYDKSRVHKFNFRKKRFMNDPLLKFDVNMTEKELSDLNNIDRIWDF